MACGRPRGVPGSVGVGGGTVHCKVLLGADSSPVVVAVTRQQVVLPSIRLLTVYIWARAACSVIKGSITSIWARSGLVPTMGSRSSG